MDTETYDLTHAQVVFPFVALLIFGYYLARVERQGLSHVPTIGPSNILLSYFWVVKHMFNAESAIEEGYRQFLTFKVATLSRWIVIVSGSQLIEELRKAPDNQLSYSQAASEIAESQPTLRAIIAHDYHHVTALTMQLTRNLPLLIADMREELAVSCHDIVPSDYGSGWAQIPVMNTISEVVSRVSNRALVGRSPVLDNRRRGSVQAAIILGLLPMFLQRITVRLLAIRNTESLHKLLRATIEERRNEILAEDYHHESHSLLSWLITESRSGPTVSRDMTRRLLALNLEVSKISTALTHAIYHLAVVNLDVVQRFRDEIEAVVRHEGWTTRGLGHMRQLDSFLKESLRVSGVRALTMVRKSISPYTFGNGIRIPEGTFVSVPCGAVHLDPQKYPNPMKFDEGRFVHQGEHWDSSPRDQMTTTTPDFLAWGHGRSACPGRFFAATVMKLTMAHIILNYDVRLAEDDGSRRYGPWHQHIWWFGTRRFSKFGVNVMVKKRQ